jgi:23S rRNA pseudouridine1911/1915/1917 synthase
MAIPRKSAGKLLQAVSRKENRPGRSRLRRDGSMRGEGREGIGADFQQDLSREDELLEEEIPEGAERTSAAKESLQFHFLNLEKPQRLDVFLCERMPGRSRGFIQKLIQTGYVILEPPGAREPRPALKVSVGTSVRVVIPPPAEISLAPEPIPLEFLYEDQYLAVINKQAGLAVHPAPDQVGNTLVNALLYWLDDLSDIAGVERPGIVHRLDKETSGVLLIAKKDVAHQALSRQFKERTIHKTYLAIVRGEPKDWEGRLDFPLGRSPTHHKKVVVRTNGTGRPSVTDYRILEAFNSYALVELYPHTGRTHQIRVHLAAIQLPVACDKLYGREKRIFLSDLRRKAREAMEEPLIERQALHATTIAFRHPVTFEEMSFTAPLYPDMLALLRALQTYRAKRG